MSAIPPICPIIPILPIFAHPALSERHAMIDVREFERCS
jgi:hypothetical protein